MSTAIVPDYNAQNDELTLLLKAEKKLPLVYAGTVIIGVGVAACAVASA
jgi:hypothetical protein